MTRIGDLLDRDLSRPVEELVKVGDDDAETVFGELTEYVATDRIKAEYERLLSAMAAGPKSPDEGVGVWISGFVGSGKSSFAKNLGHVLANRDVNGTPASAFFLNRLESRPVAESVEFLNRAVPCEIFVVDAQAELPAQSNAGQIVEVMYRALLRGLDYAESHEIAELEIELEKEGRLAAFEDLCPTEYRQEWRAVRNGSQALARASDLLHRFEPRTYGSTDAWLNEVQVRTPRRLSVADLVEKSFALCGIRRPASTFAFIVDEPGDYLAPGGERLENLYAVVDRFGRESIARMHAGKISGRVWIVVTAHETLQELCGHAEASRVGLLELEQRFQHRIDLSDAGIDEVVLQRVLRKKESRESVLRKLFRDRGAALIQNVRLERCSRRTAFDEDRFVRFYPYLPHLIDLSLDILAGIRLQPNAAKYVDSTSRTIVRQCFEMLVSDGTRLADRPIGALVSIDGIYELVQGITPWEKQKDILDIRQRFDDHPDYPGMASRVAKAICLMEFAKPGLPRTTKNIAALLIERVTEAPPVPAVAAIVERLEAARFVHWTEDGWKLYDFDELRRAAAALGWLGKAVGTVNPRPPGWRNELIQRCKNVLARSLRWYTHPQREFNASVSRSLEEVVGALDHLSRKMVALDRASMDMAAITRRDPADARPPQLLDYLSRNIAGLDRASMDINALEERLRLSEGRYASLLDSMRGQESMRGQIDLLPHGSSGRAVVTAQARQRTAYVIGLFGTGRRYINDLILRNIGERAKYFRDTIRLHPGPTPMIYSGHATMKYVSRGQELPAVMSRISEAVGWGFADSIFIYRHPLDSLLTNWIWWRTYLRDDASISGISQVYKNTDDLCADLEENFQDFQAFAEGDPDFFAGEPGPRFLSFAEFVEETELHLQSATLGLRLEDFMVDPAREFSRIVEVMSVDLDLSRLCLAPPRTRPYNYLAVLDKVPAFRNFIDGLNAETKGRIEKFGYSWR
jgi:hypothetical protein